MLSIPDSGSRRINYSRDVLVVGGSVFPQPTWRCYAEAGWAIHASGGSEPLEFQFGTEWGPAFTADDTCGPFLALNAHLHEELNFGGQFVVQAGWLLHGAAGHRYRIGFHYLAGKSNQYEFYRENEEQVGLGMWYEF
jgi:hypothetical protein